MINPTYKPLFGNPFKARKKPLVVDVWEIRPDAEPPEWTAERIFWNQNGSRSYVRILTIDGIATAGIGDFIIKGIKDEIYPCERNIFLQTYEFICE